MRLGLGCALRARPVGRHAPAGAPLARLALVPLPSAVLASAKHLPLLAWLPRHAGAHPARRLRPPAWGRAEIPARARVAPPSRRHRSEMPRGRGRACADPPRRAAAPPPRPRWPWRPRSQRTSDPGRSRHAPRPRVHVPELPAPHAHPASALLPPHARHRVPSALLRAPSEQPRTEPSTPPPAVARSLPPAREPSRERRRPLLLGAAPLLSCAELPPTSRRSRRRSLAAAVPRVAQIAPVSPQHRCASCPSPQSEPRSQPCGALRRSAPVARPVPPPVAPRRVPSPLRRVASRPPASKTAGLQRPSSAAAAALRARARSVRAPARRSGGLRAHSDRADDAARPRCV